VARKSQAVLKSAVLPLGKIDSKLLVTLKKLPDHPVEGFEQQWERYLHAVEAHGQSSAKVDMLFKVVDKKGHNHPDWPAYRAALDDMEHKYRTEIGAWDAYRYAVKHKDDKIGAPIEDVRAIVNDSLAPMIDGLQFNLNHGLLASKVAQAIKVLTIEESAGEPPFCTDCVGSE
jgi:hypothetical protein